MVVPYGKSVFRILKVATDVFFTRHVKKNTPKLFLGVMLSCHVFANVQFV